jgi:hypothetical protein
MYYTEKYGKFNMTADYAENAESIIGASVNFSIFQLFCEQD